MVPHINFTSFLQQSRLGLVILTQIHVYITRRSCVHVRSAYVVEHQNTFGLFTATVVDGSIRKTSSGGVSANKSCSLPVVFCFATSLDLTFTCCLSHFFVVDSLQWAASWSSQKLLDGLLLVHIHLPVPLINLQSTCFPLPFVGQSS